MRILHLIQRPQLRGAEIFASQIGEIHHDGGHQVIFLALFPAKGTTTLKLQGPELKELSLREDRRFFDLAGWRKLAEEIKQFRPDIVQANAADTLKYAVLSRRLFGWPGKLVYRNANKASDFITSPAKKFYNKWLAHQVNFVASVSRNCELDFQEVFAVPDRKTATLTIGTPIPEAISVQAKLNIRAQLQIPHNAPLLVNIGSLVPEKNQVGLVELFSAIVRERPDSHLLLIGDGKTKPEVERTIGENNLGHRVHLLGFRKDAVAILAACDLMILPSFIEGMPGVILEAMARRVPVIASEVGGINEIIQHGESGYLGDPAKPESFVQPALRLLSNPQMAKAMAEKAYEFVTTTKAINVIAEEFMQRYKMLLAE